MTTTHDVLNPATEELVRTVEQASVEETDETIAGAVGAGPAWRAVAPSDRGRLLRRFSDLVGEHQEELAQLEVANSGHTIGNARWEAGNVRDVLNYYSAAPERMFGRQIPSRTASTSRSRSRSASSASSSRGTSPCRSRAGGSRRRSRPGNTVVLKPAELTPLTAMRIGELALEAGLPEGVFTVIPGKGSVVGERFVTHADVRKVCFTGSTEVGQRIMRGAADRVKRITLELGGKSANVVFADADLDKAAATAPYGVFDNAGQDCCARSRILVQRSVFDEFMERFETAVKRVVVADPRDEATEMGPLISAGHHRTVSSYVEDSDESVEVAFRGATPEGRGTGTRHRRPAERPRPTGSGRRRSSVQSSP